MDRETLVAVVEALKKPAAAERDALLAKMSSAIASVMAEAKIDHIATFKMRRLDSAEVIVPREDNKHPHTFDIYFGFPFSCHGEEKKRNVQLNVGTFGSFTADDQPAVNYYTAAGALASHLSSLQQKFDALDESAYNKAAAAYDNALCELESLDRETAQKKREKEVNDIEAKLVAGTKLRIGWTWRNEPIYDTVDHATNKLIFLEKSIGQRIKKMHAVANILHKKWEFA